MNSVEKKISYFCAEMQNLGYAEGEVNAFVHDVLEERQLSKLSQEESQEVKDYLDEYLSFARKCKKTVQ